MSGRHDPASISFAELVRCPRFPVEQNKHGGTMYLSTVFKFSDLNISQLQGYWNNVPFTENCVIKVRY